jgi:cellulose synthase/poly-beta-1,6-N-acetylglucosamine synthase-like glycosyltransferase
MAKIAVVIPVLGQEMIANRALKLLSRETPRPYELIVMDNGSEPPFESTVPDVDVVRSDIVYGPYQTFWNALNITDAEILAFFHSDFMVFDKDWYKKVEAEFDRDPKLGMIGFFWSNEIDSMGGRGLGSASNFVERDGGSEAERHGRRATGFEYAAVVDGCSMILRRSALIDIGFRKEMGSHHFYDKLISTQLLEKGWKIGGLGIECAHISNQTAGTSDRYRAAAKKWLTENHITPGGMGTDWDNEMYHYSEHYWLNEYRDTKHFIPLKVNKEGNITR